MADFSFDPLLLQQLQQYSQLGNPQDGSPPIDMAKLNPQLQQQGKVQQPIMLPRKGTQYQLDTDNIKAAEQNGGMNIGNLNAPPTPNPPPLGQQSGGGSDITKSLVGLSPWTAVAGAGLGILQSAFGSKSEEERRREKEVEEALAGARNQKSQYQNTLAQSEGVRRAQEMGMQDAKSASIAAATNAAAGANANAGLGGDVNSATVAGIKAAPGVMAAAAPYAQAIGDTYNSKAQRDQAAMSGIDRNNDQIANYSQMTDYINKTKTPWLGNLLNSSMAGMNFLTNAKGLTDTRGGTT